ncbi:MAG: GNAT family N-acetyltransferase [Geminicoccaceae bacterium]
MTITIRRARSDEAGVLTDLSMRAKRSNGYDDAFMEACRAELTVRADRVEDGDYWVAVSGSVCGWVCLEDAGDRCGEVSAFFIDPEWQRRGVGRSLWRKVVERAEILGIKTLFLDSDPAAVPFYRAMGFVEIGLTPSGSIEGRMLPRMACQLDQIEGGS